MNPASPGLFRQAQLLGLTRLSGIELQKLLFAILTVRGRRGGGRELPRPPRRKKVSFLVHVFSTPTRVPLKSAICGLYCPLEPGELVAQSSFTPLRSALLAAPRHHCRDRSESSRTAWAARSAGFLPLLLGAIRALAH